MSSVDPNAHGADADVVERWKSFYRQPESTYLLPMSPEVRADGLAKWRSVKGKKTPEVEREALVEILRENNGEDRDVARDVAGLLQTKPQPFFYPQAYEKVSELCKLLVRFAERGDRKNVEVIMAEARVVQERIAQIVRTLNEEREDLLVYANPGRAHHLMRIGEITKEMYELRLCLVELSDEKLGALVRKRMVVREESNRSMHGYTKSQEDGQWNKGSDTMRGYTKDRDNGMWSKDENTRGGGGGGGGRDKGPTTDGHWRSYDGGSGGGSKGSSSSSSSTRGFY